MGLLSADVFTALEGIALIFGGGALVIGGSAEAVITSETIVLPAIGVAAIAAGGTVSGIGYKQYTNSTKQLGKDWALFAKSGSGGSNPSPKPSSPSSGQSAVDVQKILQEYRNLQNTQNFRPSAIKHIMEGDLNARGQAGGYHYENIPNTPGKLISGTESTPDPFGVYKGRVEVNGVSKISNGGRSTFFPKDMSPQEIINSINEAFSSKRLVRGNVYSGTVQSGPKAGMVIEMFLDTGGKIISAYPK
ncbi:EndoU domain-containing protein [Tumebacillus sp. DT12]|uniref:EndoU domain-containing protein n=1 Tax=Tumebacillus lacus TaxID=2995335 RepID=A0ABT3X661_9BACL|nr:EndoU domain-containing protein [Tumebacillus lacus]MCX7572390.1 EndoU domain-containing protein [Tumebacillus lacus]